MLCSDETCTNTHHTVRNSVVPGMDDGESKSGICIRSLAVHRRHAKSNMFFSWYHMGRISFAQTLHACMHA